MKQLNITSEVLANIANKTNQYFVENVHDERLMTQMNLIFLQLADKLLSVYRSFPSFTEREGIISATNVCANFAQNELKSMFMGEDRPRLTEAEENKFVYKVEKRAAMTRNEYHSFYVVAEDLAQSLSQRLRSNIDSETRNYGITGLYSIASDESTRGDVASLAHVMFEHLRELAFTESDKCKDFINSLPHAMQIFAEEEISAHQSYYDEQAEEAIQAWDANQEAR